MTTLTFHVARALGREYTPKDEVVVTELDHHGNVAPWKRLERERGIKLRMARMMPETGELDWEDLASVLSKRTKLLAIGAASNALGTITDIPRAIQMARSVGAQTFVDAVHYAPHRVTDVRHWNCDFLACSAYKFYGPHVGILYGREELLGSLDLPKLIPAPDTPPERAETGTQNHEGIAGAAAAVDFLGDISPGGRAGFTGPGYSRTAGGTGPGHGASRRKRLAQAFEQLDHWAGCLTIQMWQGLSEIHGVRLYGPPPGVPRTPTVAFNLDNISPTEVARKLASRGIFVSHGDFYALTIIERLGLIPEGVVRAGCACYTTPEEVQRLVAGVREIADEL